MANNQKKRSFKERLTLLRKTRILKTSSEIPGWIRIYRRSVHLLALITLLFIIFQSGLKWQLPEFLHLISILIDYLVFFCFLLDSVLTFIYTFPKSRYLKENWLDFLVFAPVLLNLITIQAGAGLGHLAGLPDIGRPVVPRSRTPSSHGVPRVGLREPEAH